jgi:hypothetical protein
MSPGANPRYSFKKSLIKNYLNEGSDPGLTPQPLLDALTTFNLRENTFTL